VQKHAAAWLRGNTRLTYCIAHRAPRMASTSCEVGLRKAAIGGEAGDAAVSLGDRLPIQALGFACRPSGSVVFDFSRSEGGGGPAAGANLFPACCLSRHTKVKRLFDRIVMRDESRCGKGCGALAECGREACELDGPTQEAQTPHREVSCTSEDLMSGPLREARRLLTASAPSRN